MRSPLADVWAPHIYLTPADWSGLIYLFARININPGKNDAILMAGFVRSDTDTTPLGIMMMAQRRLLGMRMNMTIKIENSLCKDDIASFWSWCGRGQPITTRTEWVLSMMLEAVIMIGRRQKWGQSLCACTLRLVLSKLNVYGESSTWTERVACCMSCILVALFSRCTLYMNCSSCMRGG